MCYYYIYRSVYILSHISSLFKYVKELLAAQHEELQDVQLVEQQGGLPGEQLEGQLPGGQLEGQLPGGQLEEQLQEEQPDEPLPDVPQLSEQRNVQDHQHLLGRLLPLLVPVQLFVLPHLITKVLFDL